MRPFPVSRPVGLTLAVTERMEPQDERSYQVGGSHYRDLEYEPFDVIEDWSRGWPTPFTTYLIGNAMKYLARLGRKGDADKAREDLDKAIHYLQEARRRL